MKYKVGDKVLVSNNVKGYINDGNGNAIHFTRDMEKYKGKIVTIKECMKSINKYSIKEDWGAYYWMDDCFEDLTSPKTLLRSGDKLTLRNGCEGYVLLETNSIYSSTGGGRIDFLSNYYDDLKYLVSQESRHDVVKVHRDGKLIWQLDEKSKEQLELEKIEAEIRELSTQQTKLADRMSELKSKIK